MKVNISKSDCNFYVNEEKRTVVCVIKEIKQQDGSKIPIRLMLLNYLREILHKYEDPKLGVNIMLCNLGEKLMMPAVVTGKSTCSSEDEWNEQLGREIAYARARQSLYKNFYRRATLVSNSISDSLDSIVEDFNLLGQKLTNAQTGLQNRIDEALEK
jgi:hypothetical protein